jgi:hypothetical protein
LGRRRCHTGRHRAGRQYFVQGADQAIDMMIKIPAAVDCYGVPKRELSDAFRKLSRLRHPGIAYENRDDWNFSVQRDFKLDSDGIRLVVDSRLRTLAAAEPSRPEHDEDRVGFRESVGDLIPEIDAGPDIVDIAKY